MTTSALSPRPFRQAASLACPRVGVEGAICGSRLLTSVPLGHKKELVIEIDGLVIRFFRCEHGHLSAALAHAWMTSAIDLIRLAHVNEMIHSTLNELIAGSHCEQTPTTVISMSGGKMTNPTPAWFANAIVDALPAIEGAAMRIIHTPDDAQDITTETVIRAMERWKQYDPSRSIVPWLCRIARNLAHDELRRRAQMPTAPLSKEADSDRDVA